MIHACASPPRKAGKGCSGTISVASIEHWTHGVLSRPNFFLGPYPFRRESRHYSDLIGFSLQVASALISFSNTSSRLANSSGRNTVAPRHSSPNLSTGTHQ